MRVLIFGGNGFLGNSLTSLLKKEDYKCFTVSRSKTVSDYNLDVSKYEEFSNLPLNFFDVIINCATVLPGGHYLDNEYLEKIYKTNVLGTQNICKWIKEQYSIKKIINCSTLAVVAKPWPLYLSEKAITYPVGNHVLYCSSKLNQELIFKTFASLNDIILTQIRFSALYGEEMNRNGLICKLIDQAKNNKKICVTNASQVSSDFLYVEDASKIILAAIRKDLKGVVNGASGVESSILKIAKIISENSSEYIEIENEENESFKNDRTVVSVEVLKK
jgi:UDP-glucose 4-epimerase